MGALWDVQLVLSDESRAPLLELLAFGARCGGPPRRAQGNALESVARALGLGGERQAADALGRAERRVLPPRLDGLSALERRVAVGALAWLLGLSDEPDAPARRGLLEFVAEEAEVSAAELGEVGAAVARVQRHCRGRVTWGVEFELLLIELLHVGALAPSRQAPALPHAGGAGEAAAERRPL